MVSEIGVMQLQAQSTKDSQQPSEARTEAWVVSPSEPPEGTNSANTSILDFWLLEL